MKSKKWYTLISLILLVSLGLSLVGCGTSSNSTTPDSEDKSDDKADGGTFKAAFMTSSTISDNGWGAAGYNGLKAVEEELGIETAYTESVAQSDVEEVLRGYATQKYNIIFAHGSEFIDGAKKVAPEFPETYFVVTNGYYAQDNISSFSVNSAEMGFLEGAVAAIITETKKVGVIGGQETLPIKLGVEGFVQGVKYIDPSVEVTATYSGSFTDVPKLKEIAISMINNGADVVLGNANAAGLGAIEAAKENGVYAIGSSSDQHAVAPDTVVTSGVQNIGKAMTFITKTIMDGQYEPRVYIVGVKEGAVYLAPLYEFETKLPADQVARIKQIEEDIKSGKVEIKLDTETGKVEFIKN